MKKIITFAIVVATASAGLFDDSAPKSPEQNEKEWKHFLLGSKGFYDGYYQAFYRKNTEAS